MSGQLYAEMLACSLSRVYSFGPTFRAEHSNTTRHLNEFWMVEPEMAHADLDTIVALAERFVKFVLAALLKNCDHGRRKQHKPGSGECSRMQKQKLVADICCLFYLCLCVRACV